MRLKEEMKDPNSDVARAFLAWLLHATRGDLLMRLQRPAEAADCFRTALRLAESGAATDAERRFLARRLAETGEPV